jgi:gentisate 1,2-dioxygenase
MTVFGFVDGKATEVVDPMTLEQARAERQAEVDAICRGILDQAGERYSALEKSTWTQKREQAEAYQASGDPADCPALALEALATARILSGGEPSEAVIKQALDSLTTGIVSKAAQIEALQAQVIGWRSAMSVVLGQLPTISAVQDFPLQPPL